MRKLTRRSDIGKTLRFLVDPSAGVYQPGSFPAPAAGGKKTTHVVSFPGVDSWTVSLLELAQVKKAHPGGAGICSSVNRISVASSAATWTSRSYTNPCLFLVAPQHPTRRTRRRGPQEPEPIKREAKMLAPPPDVTQGPRTEASQPGPQSLQWL